MILVQSLLLALFIAFVPRVFAEKASRIVKCSDSNLINIWIKPNIGSVLSFPVKPDNVVLMGQRLFSIEYIKNDIAITPQNSGGSTNLFVYLSGRRCAFRLITSASHEDNMVRVEDPDELKMKVKFHE